MNGNILLALGPLSLTAYGLWIGAGALLWLLSACAVRRWKYRRLPAGAVWLGGFCMVVLGALCSRAVYCAANFDRFLGEGLKWLHLWEGGMSMAGALPGAALGLLLAAGMARVRPGRLMNCFAPGLGLFVLCVVAAQMTIGEGWGKIAEAAWVAQTPLGVRDLYGDVRYAVFRVEMWGCALAVLAGLVPLCRRRPARFGAWCWAMGVYCAMRIVTASMREGAILRVEYFRIEQIAGAVMLLAVCVCRLVCGLRGGAGARAWAGLIVFLLGLGLCLWMEFAVDREGRLEEKYALMSVGAALCLAGALGSGGRRGRRTEKQRADRARMHGTGGK